MDNSRIQNEETATPTIPAEEILEAPVYRLEETESDGGDIIKIGLPVEVGDEDEDEVAS